MSKICIILFHLLILSGSGEDNLIEWHPSSQTLESFIKCYYTDTPGVSSGAVASAVRLLRCIHFSLSCWSFLGSVIFMSCLDPQGSSELSLLSPAPLHPVSPSGWRDPLYKLPFPDGSPGGLRMKRQTLRMASQTFQ